MVVLDDLRLQGGGFGGRFWTDRLRHPTGDHVVVGSYDRRVVPWSKEGRFLYFLYSYVSSYVTENQNKASIYVAYVYIVVSAWLNPPLNVYSEDNTWWSIGEETN